MLLKATLECEEKCLVSLKLVMLWLTWVHGRLLFPLPGTNRGGGVNVGKRGDGGETGRSQGKKKLWSGCKIKQNKDRERNLRGYACLKPQELLTKSLFKIVFTKF